MLILSGIIVLYFLLTFSRVFAVTKMILNASNQIHKKIVYNILRTKINFFDQNPIGKIMTRFSKDIVVFDNILPLRFSVFTVGFFRVLSILIAIVYINYFLIIPIVVFGVFMILFARKI